MIDSHLHLWDLGTGDYVWNTPDLGAVLHTSFDTVAATRALASGHVARAVLVQGADTIGDTQRLLTAAASQPWAAGVVAWVPLDDPDRAHALLDRWAANPMVVGVRQLLHDHPDPWLLASPGALTTLRVLARHGLPLDVPDAWPTLWPALMRAVGELEDLTVIVDHLGKPRLSGPGRQSPGILGDDFDRWRRDLTTLAERPSTVGKLSGLGATFGPGTPVTSKDVAPLVDVALEAFGPNRLMFGGDWPVSLTNTEYRDTVAYTCDAISALSAHEQDAILANTAARVYGLAAG